MYDEINIGNPYFIQTIELLKYLDKLKSLKNGEVNRELMDGSIVEPKLKMTSCKLNSTQKYTKESIDDLCHKTMLLILTHAGYHEVDQECFNLLVDLMKSYMKNLTSMFRKKLDQESITGSSASSSNQSLYHKSSDHELVLLGKVFNELGLPFSTFQQFNYGLVLYRDHVLNQIDDLKIELNIPVNENE